jgi:AraC-like DNA-binding protein
MQYFFIYNILYFRQLRRKFSEKGEWTMDGRQTLFPVTFEAGGSGKARCEPGWNWNPPPLSDYDLWYVVSGTGRMRLSHTWHNVSKGTCMLLWPGDSPQAEQNLEDRLIVIFVHFRMREDLKLPPRRTQIEETREFEEGLHRLLDAAARRGSYAEEEFDSLLKLLLVELHRASEAEGNLPRIPLKQRRAVTRAIHLIQQESGTRISHDVLAGQVGLSAKYLSALFKQTTGLSLKQYLTKVRLERGMHLLSETSMNVSQVAEAIGYANVYLFSKQFKQHFGQPPSDYLLKAPPPRSHP